MYMRTDDVNVNLLLAHFLYLMRWIAKSVTNIITKSIEVIGKEIFILSYSSQSTRVVKCETRASRFKKL
jgi:hypothetical protein